MIIIFHAMLWCSSTSFEQYMMLFVDIYLFLNPRNQDQLDSTHESRKGFSYLNNADTNAPYAKHITYKYHPSMLFIYLFFYFFKAMTYSSDIDRGWAWLVVASSFLTHTLTYGVAWSTGVYNTIFIDAFGDSKTVTAWAGSLTTASMYAAGEAKSAAYCSRHSFGLI